MAELYNIYKIQNKNIQFDAVALQNCISYIPKLDAHFPLIAQDCNIQFLRIRNAKEAAGS